jgi:hypothetical protein
MMDNIAVAELYTGNISNDGDLEQAYIIDTIEDIVIDIDERYKKDKLITYCIMVMFTLLFIGIIIYLLKDILR